MDESDWRRLTRQLETGECTPFLGAGACHGTLPTGGELSRAWAAKYDYPFIDGDNLARVMQYAAADIKDAVTLKREVCDHLLAAGRPDFTRDGEIHSFLARFPIPVFLTTNYDDFLVEGLRARNKTPHPAICPWHDGLPYDRKLFERGAGLRPEVARPVVYHLHGSVERPDSLVLTEDDYLEFLVHMTAARTRNNRQIMPPAILDALANRPLLFIGYSLQDWTFRVLFHGLISRYPAIRRRRHVSVQLPPPGDHMKTGATERAKMYLGRYFDGWDISIFWGSAQEFCGELGRRMGTAP
ncbi:SIR2 family NAD-dependent protein deacylase [Sphaerisporangium corydalis]|uniref:SIR2 family protein n=1 Tax=Sphaerisporangium corydalis TaxID=1441875 RepID=A0ABV9EKJ6_9ACTN|nr:SIR2 family protein [Sphaerisporangium corydalis]